MSHSFWSLVEAVGGPENGEPGARCALDDRPVDRRRPAVFRQQRRMVLDRAMTRDVDEVLRRELQHVRHDAKIDVEPAHRLLRFARAQRLELKNFQPFFLRRGVQRIELGARLFRRAKDARHFIAAREKRLEHGLAIVLLANNCDFHNLLFRQESKSIRVEHCRNMNGPDSQ
jgi:hypothetical protein